MNNTSSRSVGTKCKGHFSQHYIIRIIRPKNFIKMVTLKEINHFTVGVKKIFTFSITIARSYTFANQNHNIFWRGNHIHEYCSLNWVQLINWIIDSPLITDCSETRTELVRLVILNVNPEPVIWPQSLMSDIRALPMADVDLYPVRQLELPDQSKLQF